MPEQESILQLKAEIQTLKIKDEYRSKELDALMSKLDDTTSKLNSLSENIGRLLAGQESHKARITQCKNHTRQVYEPRGAVQLFVWKFHLSGNFRINSNLY